MGGLMCTQPSAALNTGYDGPLESVTLSKMLKRKPPLWNASVWRRGRGPGRVQRF